MSAPSPPPDALPPAGEPGACEGGVLDQLIVADEHNPRWPILPPETCLPPLSPTLTAGDKLPFSPLLPERFEGADGLYPAGSFFGPPDAQAAAPLFAPDAPTSAGCLVDPPGLSAVAGALPPDAGALTPTSVAPFIVKPEAALADAPCLPPSPPRAREKDPEWEPDRASSSSDAGGALAFDTDADGLGGLTELMRRDYGDDDMLESNAPKKKVQKPPTTAGITLDNLKAVFGLERPEAEKRLGLKRTTFSNLSRYYGISKWPFRTIRDATNRKEANEIALRDKSLSKEKRKKLLRQQNNLQGVINLMYSDPSQSKDSNTLAVLMNIVSSKDEGNY